MAPGNDRAVVGSAASWGAPRPATPAEALAAGLCASFIVASGVVKSIGRTLIETYGVAETWMPFLPGMLFAFDLFKRRNAMLGAASLLLARGRAAVSAVTPSRARPLRTARGVRKSLPPPVHGRP